MRPEPRAMEEATDPETAAGDVAAARESVREALPVTPPAPAGPAASPVEPARRAHVPRIMMFVLSAISLTLGFGYLAWLFTA